MNDLLHTKTRQKYYYITSALALVLLIAFRFFVLPTFSSLTQQSLPSIIASMLEVLIASLLASLAATSIILWLTPGSNRTAMMDVVWSMDIHETMREALDRTSEWHYRGHIGRYFRAETLPRLAEDSKATNTTKNVYLQLIDPRDEKVCTTFARFRTSQRNAPRNIMYTARAAKLETIATITAAPYSQT